MEQITWGGFKALIERQAQEQGIDDLDDREVHYIDMLGFDPDDIGLFIEKDGSISID